LRKGRDTMAMGNITGAMVFQGSVLPAVGIFLTPWTANLTVVTSSIFTIIAAVWLYLFAVRARELKPSSLIINGVLYIAFIIIVVFREAL
ncbi:MAG: sodium:calcium antiporter, partial [Deltaproteobacteria bacterium]|nr:sodium:calcium antiporter [Deltaproteobacteria bacterium]